MSDEEGDPDATSTKPRATSPAPTKPSVELMGTPPGMKAPPPSCPVVQPPTAKKPPSASTRRGQDHHEPGKEIAQLKGEEAEGPDTRRRFGELLTVVAKQEDEPKPADESEAATAGPPARIRKCAYTDVRETPPQPNKHRAHIGPIPAGGTAHVRWTTTHWSPTKTEASFVVQKKETQQHGKSGTRARRPGPVWGKAVAKEDARRRRHS